MKTQNDVKVEFAEMTAFFPRNQFGFAKTDTGETIFVHMENCRKVLAGVTKPELSYENCGAWPERESKKIVFIRDYRHPRNGQKVKALRWGYRRFWDRVVHEIAMRPYYRVMGENRFKGQVMNGTCRHQAVESGTMEELQSKFPRGTLNDPIGTDKPYRTSPCTRINHCERYDGTDAEGKEIWTACGDPRPLPKSTPADRELMELANSVNGKRKGTTTPRPGELVTA